MKVRHRMTWLAARRKAWNEQSYPLVQTLQQGKISQATPGQETLAGSHEFETPKRQQDQGQSGEKIDIVQLGEEKLSH